MARTEDDRDPRNQRKRKPPSKSHPRKPERQGASRRGLTYGVGAYGYYGMPTYGPGYYQGLTGGVTGTGVHNSPPVVEPEQGGHLNAEQFVGYPGGFVTNAGNYTGAEALAGAEGNGGAGGDGGGSV
jgi:hypothetical protein